MYVNMMHVMVFFLSVHYKPVVDYTVELLFGTEAMFYISALYYKVIPKVIFINKGTGTSLWSFVSQSELGQFFTVFAMADQLLQLSSTI